MIQNTRKPESENISDLKFKLKLFSIFLISSCFLFVTFLIMPIEVYVPFAFVTTIVFSFPIGYAFLESVKKIAQNPLIVKFSLYTGTGFIICFFWSFFISPFTVHPLAFFLLFIISIIIIFINFYRKIHSAKIKEDFYKNENLNIQKTNHSWDFRFIRLGEKLILNTNQVILIAVIVVAAVYTTNEINGWPSFSDTARHSYWTSMQIFQGHVVSHIPLFPDEPLTYPLGIHLFAANLSTLYEISPPQIFLMLGGVSIFFIFTSILSITYVLTKSAWISLIATASMLYVHSSDVLAKDLLSTTDLLIPNIIAIFFMFLLILFLITIRNNVNVKNFLLLFLLILTGIIIYPPVLVYSIILVIAFFITNYQLFKVKRKPSINLDYSFKTKIKKITQSLHLYLFIIIIIGMSSGTLLQIPSNFYHSLIEQKAVEDGFPHVSYYVTSEIYADEFFIVSTIVGIICSIFVIMYQKRERFLGIFVLLFILITITGDYHPGLSKIILSPARFAQMEPILSWILVGFVIGVFLNSSSSISKNSTKIKNHKKPLEGRSKTLLKYGVILMFAVLTISLIPNLRGENYAIGGARAEFHHWSDPSLYSFKKNEGKYGYMEPYMPGFNWIKNNVTPDKLIFNFWWTTDEPYLGKHFQSPYKWLDGISYQHYLNDKISRDVFLTQEQIGDINSAFRNYDYDFELRFTLHYYDISFILTRPDYGRDDILEQYFFLESVYADDFTRIYQVSGENITEYFSSLLEETNKQDISDFEGTIKIYEKILSVEKFLPKSFPTVKTLLTDLFRSYVVELGDNESGLKTLKIYTEHYRSSYDKTLYDELKPVALKLAKNFEDKSETRKAITVYDTLLNLDKFDYESLINKGRLHEVRGEYSLALQTYERAYSINPNDEIQFKISNLLTKHLNYFIESNNSEFVLETLIVLSVFHKPHYSPAFDDEIRLIALKLAKNFEDKSETRKAITVYDTLLNLDKFDYESLINKGRLHEVRGEYGLALVAYKQANKINPNDEMQFKISNLLAKIRTK